MIVARKLFRNFTYTKSLLNSLCKLQESARKIHTGVMSNMKMFMEHENKYAYNIMESKGYAISLTAENYKLSLTKEEFDQVIHKYFKYQPKDNFKNFSLLGDYCAEHNICISNKMFDNFLDYLTDNIKEATDEELQSIFYSLVKWPETESIRTRNFIEVWAALDDECFHRVKTWSFDKLLSYLSLFYMINVTRVSDFSNKSLQKLASKAKQLSPAQIVQTMFFIGVMRKQPHDMHNLELQIDQQFQEFSIDDLAIISMGFFKSKTPIRSMELVKKIINKIIDNPKHIHEVSLAALVKVIRYSMKFTVDDTIYKLLEILQYEVHRLSIMCNVHVALLGTSTLTLHEECLIQIADRVMKSISDARLKDLERLVLTYATFNFEPPTTENLFEKVLEELRKPERGPEIVRHGRSFACCLSYLGLLGIYPVDLMNKALDQDFLEKAYGKQCYYYGREILAIHNTSQIFCRETNMNRLSDRVARILAKRYTDYVPNEDYNKQYNVSEKMFLDVFKVLELNRGGKNYVIGDHIVTHHQRGDIIICNNHDGSPLPVETFEKEGFGLLRKSPDSNHWIVFVIAGRNALIRKTNIPTGHFQAKIRELKALGFHGILVPWSAYTQLKTCEEKSTYLNSLIHEAMNNK